MNEATIKLGDNQWTIRPLTLGQLRVALPAFIKMAKAMRENDYDVATVIDCAAAVVALAVSLPIEEILALTCPMMDLVEATNQVALVSGLQQGEALAKTVPQTSRRGAKSTEASPQSAATATL